ncbi:hypothetical protein MTO96_037018 [Rhipicephalus appendiculatus]
MERILRQIPVLHEFTFSSDIPDRVEDESFPTTLFNAHFCANAGVNDGCVWLRDLVLDPTHREPFSGGQPFAAVPHPMAEGAYVGDLRVFFSVFASVVQLNVNSFHFGADVDLTRLPP